MPASQNLRTTTLAAYFVGFSLVFFLALLPVGGASIDVREGEVASRTVRSGRELSFVSQSLTRERQEEAAASVPNRLTYDPSVASRQQSLLAALLSRISLIILDPGLNQVSKSLAFDRLDGLALSASSRSYLATMRPTDFLIIETEAPKALASIYELSLPSSQVIEIRERAINYVDPGVNRDSSILISELIRPFIVTNQIADSARTEADREAARASVAPVQVAYARNQVIVERGGVISSEALEALRELGVVRSAWQPAPIGASVLLAGTAAFIALAGARALSPQIAGRQLLAFLAAAVLPVVFTKLSLPLLLPDEQRHFLIYALPVAAPIIVLAGLIGRELAILAAALATLLTAFAAGLLVNVAIVDFAGSLDLIRLVIIGGAGAIAGALAVRDAQRLSHFLTAGLAVAATALLSLAATWLIDPDRTLRDWVWMSSAAALSGTLGAFLSAGIYVTSGSLFGVTTRFQLLEMVQLDQPLLLRLQQEAPSTFQHSIIVANLAEKGALAIGADALLTRVGCYYHDIGKLRRPGFFIENQLGGENPHDLLEPEDSARVIIGHVLDGQAMAREFKLPARVAAFIPEHHGTRPVSYFYRTALARDGSVDARDFSYAGPRPQSRETAIAMLADSCEAATRASIDHSDETISRVVDDIFSERLAEAQFDECAITMSDLRLLAASFKESLRAIYHPRVEYPPRTAAEPRRGAFSPSAKES